MLSSVSSSGGASCVLSMSGLSALSSKGKMRWCDMSEDDSEEDEQTEADMFPTESATHSQQHSPNMKGDSNVTPPSSSSPSSMDSSFLSPNDVYSSKTRSTSGSVSMATDSMSARALSDAQIHTPPQSQHVSSMHSQQLPVNSAANTSSSTIGFGGLFKAWTAVVSHTANIPASSSASTLIDDELDSSRHGLPLLLKQAAAFSSAMDTGKDTTSANENDQAVDMEHWEKVKGSKKRTHAQSNAKAEASSSSTKDAAFKVPNALRKPTMKNSPPQFPNRSHSSVSSSSSSLASSAQIRPPVVRIVKKDAMQVSQSSTTPSSSSTPTCASSSPGWSRAKSVQLIRGISGSGPSNAIHTASNTEETNCGQDADSVPADSQQFQRVVSNSKKSKKKQRISHAHYREVTPASTPRQTPPTSKQTHNTTPTGEEMDHIQLNSAVTTPKHHPQLQKSSSSSKPATSTWQGWARTNSAIVNATPKSNTNSMLANSSIIPTLSKSSTTNDTPSAKNDSESVHALPSNGTAVPQCHSQEQRHDTTNSNSCAVPALAEGVTDELSATTADSESLCRRTLSLESTSSVLSVISQCSVASCSSSCAAPSTNSAGVVVCATDTAPVAKKVPPVLSWDERLKQRQKQIDIGKRTLGYQRYTAQVPKNRRAYQQPRTPDIHKQCSKRSWDGQVRKWRRQLHLWDPPGMEQPTPANHAQADSDSNSCTSEEFDQSASTAVDSVDEAVSSAEAELRALEAEELIDQVAAGRF